MTKKHTEQHQDSLTVLSSIPQSTKTENIQTKDLENVSKLWYNNIFDFINPTLRPTSDFADFNEYHAYRRAEHHRVLTEILFANQAELAIYKFAKTLNELAISNPTNLSNPHWQAVVRYNLDAYEIANALDLQIESNTEIGLENRWNVPPLWCMGRMGQSCTVLPDGREVLIGGEYEDFYDPQFFIYNDVIVKSPNGEVEIYGYPKHIFPPTDFHTATLVDNEIWIIGSLGYQDNRQYSHTQVYKLNINTFKMEQVATRNSMGWVHHHNAEYKDGQIIVSGGQISPDEDSLSQEQTDSWALNLKTLIWTNLTNHQWQGFFVERKDFDWLHLFEYKSVYRYSTDLTVKKDIQALQDEIGIKPDIELFATLFTPPIEHTIPTFIDEEEDYHTVTIYIDDIKVRYIEDCQTIQVIIEGILPDKTLDLLKENLCYKLAKLENSPCEVTDIFF